MPSPNVTSIFLNGLHAGNAHTSLLLLYNLAQDSSWQLPSFVNRASSVTKGLAALTSVESMIKMMKYKAICASKKTYSRHHSLLNLIYLRNIHFFRHRTSYVISVINSLGQLNFGLFYFVIWNLTQKMMYTI